MRTLICLNLKDLWYVPLIPKRTTDLVSNLQERLYFADIHVLEENIAHILQGLRFCSELKQHVGKQLNTYNYLNKPGLSISGKWVSNTEDNIANLIEKHKIYRSQLNLVLDKMKNIKTLMN